MNAFRKCDGSVITDQQRYACEQLYDVAKRICDMNNVDWDFTDTHCFDLPWEVVVTKERDVHGDLDWEDFKSAWARASHDFPFVPMETGWDYERRDDGALVLSFRDASLGMNEEIDGYPIFFEDVFDAVRQWESLYEITIDTGEHIIETGVYSYDPYATIHLCEEEWT